MMALNNRKQSIKFSFKIRMEYRLPFTYLRELSKVDPVYQGRAISWQTIFEFGCMTMEGLYPKGYTIIPIPSEDYHKRTYNNTNIFTGTILEDMKGWERRLNLRQAELMEFFAWLYFMVHMNDEQKAFFNIDRLAFEIRPQEG